MNLNDLFGKNVCSVNNIYLFIWALMSLSKHYIGHVMMGSFYWRRKPVHTGQGSVL